MHTYNNPKTPQNTSPHTTHHTPSPPSSRASSLLYVAGALLNWRYCRSQPKVELRFRMMALAVLAVGLGSTAFHGTLLFEHQMLDELPMLYAMCVWW